MKLRKILAAFLAGAVAMSSMVFSSSAADYTGGVTLAYNSGNGSSWGYFNGDYSGWGVMSLSGVTMESTTVGELKELYGTVDATITPTAFTVGEGLAGLDNTPAITHAYIKVELSISETAGGNVYKVNGNNPIAGTTAKFSALNTPSTSSIDLSALDSTYDDYIIRDISPIIGMDFGSQTDVSGAVGDKSVTIKFSGNPVATGQSVETIEYETKSYTHTTIAGDANNCYLFEGDWDSSAISGRSAALTIDAVSSGWGFHIQDLNGTTLVENVWVNEGATYSILLSELDVSNGIQLITWGNFEFNGISIKNEKGKTIYTPEVPSIPVTSITLNETAVTLNVGESYDLAATVEPDNATDPTVDWESSDPTTVSVDNGTVKGLKSGTATITAKAGDETATCTVTVNNPVTAISLPAKATVVTGKTTALTATSTPEDCDEYVLVWESSDTAIATVTDGVVTGVKAGTVTITATVKDTTIKATTAVTVSDEEIPATSIELSVDEIEISIDETFDLGATVEPENCTDEITYKSSDTSVATVDAAGKVKGIKTGTATITATAGDKTATCKITVVYDGFDKTGAEFSADDAGKIVAQTATVEGKKAVRFTMLTGMDAIEKATKVEFTLSNGTETKVYTTDKYYTSLTASGKEVTAPEGYGFVTLTITDIPDGVTVTCSEVLLHIAN